MDDPNAPDITYILIRSNALLAAAVSLQASSILPVPAEAVFARARQYEAFLERPVGHDQAQAA